MDCTHKISVTDILSKNSLVTREVASFLISKLKNLPYYTIEVDFSNIDFISRSFADQFHKEKVDLWDSRTKNIIVINAHVDVYSMFKAVSKTQNSSNRDYHSYTLIQFQTRRSLKDYLQSI